MIGKSIRLFKNILHVNLARFFFFIKTYLLMKNLINFCWISHSLCSNTLFPCVCILHENHSIVEYIYVLGDKSVPGGCSCWQCHRRYRNVSIPISAIEQWGTEKKAAHKGKTNAPGYYKLITKLFGRDKIVLAAKPLCFVNGHTYATAAACLFITEVPMKCIRISFIFLLYARTEPNRKIFTTRWQKEDRTGEIEKFEICYGPIGRWKFRLTSIARMWGWTKI